MNAVVAEIGSAASRMTAVVAVVSFSTLFGMAMRSVVGFGLRLLSQMHFASWMLIVIMTMMARVKVRISWVLVVIERQG